MASKKEEVLENHVDIIDSTEEPIKNPTNCKEKSEVPNKELEESFHSLLRRSQRTKSAQKYRDGSEKLESSTSGFNLQEKIQDPRFKRHNLIGTLENGEGFNYKFFQTNGFQTPLLIKERDGLGKLLLNFTLNFTPVEFCINSYVFCVLKVLILHSIFIICLFSLSTDNI